MALESATYISDLNSSNPAASDAISTADDHLRLIKSTIKATFPNIDGPVTVDQDDINGLAPLASPTFTGTPAAPTASPGTDTTQIATTAFVTAADDAERTAAATLTNKTLTSPTINTPTISGGTITGITDLAVADGGTGASTFATNNVLLGNGTSSFQTVAPGTSGNVLTSNGTTWASSTPTNYNSSTISNSGSLTSNLAGTSRVLGTTYTNSSGKPRVVYVSGSNANNTHSPIRINGTAVMTINCYGSSAGMCFIVPSGATYQVDSGAMNLSNWFEFS